MNDGISPLSTTVLIAVYLAALYAGYVWANYDNAAECRNVNGFYVGNTVYKCEKVK